MTSASADGCSISLVTGRAHRPLNDIAMVGVVTDVRERGLRGLDARGPRLARARQRGHIEHVVSAEARTTLRVVMA